jgi:DNA-binding CsgD family transcriptional regulator
MGQVSELSKSSDGLIGTVLDGIVGRSITFDKSAVIMFKRNSTPDIIYDNFSDIVESGCLDNFLRHSHVMSPIYQCFVNNTMPNVSTARQIASRVPFHKDLPYLLSLHISSKPNAISDEIYITSANATHCVCYIAIRTVPTPSFSDIDVQQVKSSASKVQDLLGHLLNFIGLPDQVSGQSCTVVSKDERAASSHALAVPSAPAPDGIRSIELGIDKIFKERLSPREHASISLTLQGNSVDDIAYSLSISPHTVRVHMRNAYSKLRVRNRLELFAMFLKHAGFKGKDNASLL